MTEPLLLVPRHFCRVKIFEQREVYHLVGENWEFSPTESTPSLEQQIDDWLDATANLVQAVAAPHLQEIEPDETTRGYLSSIALTFVPALEGADKHESRQTSQPKAIVAAAAGNPAVAAAGHRTEAPRSAAEEKPAVKAAAKPTRDARRRPSPQLGRRTR